MKNIVMTCAETAVRKLSAAQAQAQRSTTLKTRNRNLVYAHTSSVVSLFLALIGTVMLSALGATPAAAQVTSSLTGIVTDEQGAVIAGVDVRLTSAATAFSARTTTNTSGTYEFAQVPPGADYTLSFAKAGFEAFALNHVRLGIGNKETHDAQLKIGDVKTTVEVSASSGATLNTTDASIGTEIEGARVQDLPSLFVNNAAAFLELAPGVESTGDTSQQGVVTGTRGDQANLTLDGLDINDERIGQAFTTVVNTPLDSIQELRVIVGGDDASYGHSAGARPRAAPMNSTGKLTNTAARPSWQQTASSTTSTISRARRSFAISSGATSADQFLRTSFSSFSLTTGFAQNRTRKSIRWCHCNRFAMAN